MSDSIRFAKCLGTHFKFNYDAHAIFLIEIEERNAVTSKMKPQKTNVKRSSSQKKINKKRKKQCINNIIIMV